MVVDVSIGEMFVYITMPVDNVQPVDVRLPGYERRNLEKEINIFHARAI